MSIQGSAEGFTHFSRKILLVVIVAAAVVIFAGAAAVPFVWESQTLWYKFGLDKTMLRTGQIAGMAALVLLFLQIVLAVRGKFLEKLFGIAALMKLHRANGLVVALLAIVHALLVLVPEGLANLPIGVKYWPEMVGGLLLWVVCSVAVSSHYREQLKIEYRKWRAVHKPLGYIAFVLVVVHVLFVSDSFENQFLRITFLLLSTAVLARVVGVKYFSKIDK
jgi:predicted ferric reductase